MKRCKLLVWLCGEIQEVSRLGECTGSGEVRRLGGVLPVLCLDGDTPAELEAAFDKLKKGLMVADENNG